METAEIVATINDRLRVRPSDNYSYWACDKRTGRRVRLDRYRNSYGMRLFPAAGRFVAGATYDLRYEEGDDAFYTVVFTLTDVRTGVLYRVVRDYSILEEIVDAVVKRNGSLAYERLIRGGEYQAVWTCEIATCYDKNRRAVNDRAVDVGKIGFQSLKLDGSSLTWTNAGQLRSAVLR